MSKRIYSTDSFGGFLRELRKERGIGFDQFRSALNVSKAYYNDVETDCCRPPTPELQIKMIRLLGDKQELTPQQIAKFYTLAAEKRGELPADVIMYLTVNAQEIGKIRSNPDYIEYWQKNGQ